MTCSSTASKLSDSNAILKLVCGSVMFVLICHRQVFYVITSATTRFMKKRVHSHASAGATGPSTHLTVWFMVDILFQIKPNLIPDLGRFTYLAEVLLTVSTWWN